ncbi:MAG: acyltransferase [Proteobacteria bacterium]|nr:acyltransferase [Pseudomonadota bacterium]
MSEQASSHLNATPPSDTSEAAVAPAMTPQQAKFSSSSGASALQLYRELAVGDAGWGFLMWYELVTVLTAGLPGLLGLGLRSVLYPTLLGKAETRPAFGRGVVLRNPKRIALGKRVVADDYSVLDVRGAGAITLGDHVTIGRFTTLAAKDGAIELGAGCNIGSYCRVATQSSVRFGQSVLVGAYSYIGPGNHKPAEDGRPLIAQEMEIKGGVEIGSHAWIGAGVTILDGVKIGEGAVVGAHSLVIADVPAGATVAGSPAKIIKSA